MGTDEAFRCVSGGFPVSEISGSRRNVAGSGDFTAVFILSERSSPGCFAKVFWLLGICF
jgi:hypothetical protein